MSPKWLIFFVSVWVCGLVLGLAIENAWIGTNEQSTLNVLMNSRVLTSTTFFGKVAGIFTDTAMWGAIGKMFIWDFAFFTGTWGIVRWIIFIPISIGILFTIITAWIRGVGGGG